MARCIEIMKNETPSYQATAVGASIVNISFCITYAAEEIRVVHNEMTAVVLTVISSTRL
jgi:hypothetical protein